MPQPFPDSCQRWLGLPQPPRHFYELLGLAIGETNPDRIADAVQRTRERLAQVPAAERSGDWQTLADQIQLAHQTLTTDSLRVSYDATLDQPHSSEQPSTPNTQPPGPGAKPFVLEVPGGKRPLAPMNLDLGKSERRFTVGSLTGVPGAGKATGPIGPLAIQPVSGKAAAASSAAAPSPATTLPSAPAAASASAPAAAPAMKPAAPRAPKPPAAPLPTSTVHPKPASPTTPAAPAAKVTPAPAAAPAPKPAAPRAPQPAPPASPAAKVSPAPTAAPASAATPPPKPSVPRAPKPASAPPPTVTVQPKPMAPAPPAAPAAPVSAPPMNAAPVVPPEAPAPTPPAAAQPKRTRWPVAPRAEKISTTATRERSAPAKLEIRIPAASEPPSNQTAPIAQTTSATTAAMTSPIAPPTLAPTSMPPAGPQDPSFVPPPPTPADTLAAPPVPQRRSPRRRTQTPPLPWWATLLGLVAFGTVMGSLYFAVNHWMKPRQAARLQAPDAEPSDASELPLPEVKPRPQPKPNAASSPPANTAPSPAGNPDTAVKPAAPPAPPTAISEPKPVEQPPAEMPPATMPPRMDGPGADMVREPDSIDTPMPAAPETKPTPPANQPPATPPTTTPTAPPPVDTATNPATNDMKAEEAPRELESDAQRQVLSKLKLAKRAIVERRLEEARKAIEAASELAADSTLEPPVTRLSLIADHVDQFWQAFEEGLKGLGGQEITLGGKLASVIEVRPKELLVRIEGRNRKFNRERLPTGIAIAIADRALKPEAGSSDVFRGAYLAVQTPADRAKVMAEWKKAQEKGVPVDELLPFLDDRYETATPRRSRTRGARAAGGAAGDSETADDE